MFSIILVEDEYVQRKILRKMVEFTGEDIKIYEADSENSALQIIENNDIHLFLIDIGLNNSSGLDLAIKIRDIPKYEFRPIVFLTTHTAYLTRAFKQTHCYDYILKPYNERDVSNMLNKLILNEKNNKPIEMEDKKIVIMLKTGIYVEININDIFFIEIKNKQCELNTINGIYIVHKFNLKKILKLIGGEDIVQSHKSFAINVNYICKIERIDPKLSTVYFYEYTKTAFLGYKFRESVVSKFKKGKVVLC